MIDNEEVLRKEEGLDKKEELRLGKEEGVDWEEREERIAAEEGSNDSVGPEFRLVLCRLDVWVPTSAVVTLTEFLGLAEELGLMESSSSSESESESEPKSESLSNFSYV